MGYSKNPALVRKAAELLQPLLSGKSVTWNSLANPDRFAYRIRECLAIVRRHPAQFPELAKVAHLYKITPQESSVCAHLVTEPDWKAMTTDQVVYAEKVQPPNKQVVDAPTSVLQVVNAWIHSRPSELPIVLTNCTFSNLELEKLAVWAESQEPKWMVVHEEGTKTVTLMLEESDAERV